MFNIFGLGSNNVSLEKMKFQESPAIEQRRKAAIEKLGDRHILKGGDYKGVNGKNPSFVGQQS